MHLVRLFRTNDSAMNLVLRVTLAVVFLPHGAQKLFGWFGGGGFDGTMGYFTAKLGVPAPLAFLVIMAESLGAIGLALGAGTRIAAAGIVAVMLGAVKMAHWQNGFFMNWSGGQGGEGFEYHLLVLGIASVLVVYGGGRLSVDRWIAAWLERRAHHEEPTAGPAGIPARKHA